MESDRIAKITRLPGEKQEMFLARLLLQLLSELDREGVPGAYGTLLEDCASDLQACARKGRARPGGRV